MREGSPKKVLLVDDDSNVRALVARHLEKQGFKTLQAEDGIDGLVKLREELPAAIISDLQMPRMAGIEFVCVIRRRFPTIPIIVLSGSTPRELPKECGPDVWIEKNGLSFLKLLQTLRDLIQRTPERTGFPLVADTPLQTQAGFAGDGLLNCPECLRAFRAMSTASNARVEADVVCAHCAARVSFPIPEDN